MRLDELPLLLSRIARSGERAETQRLAAAAATAGLAAARDSRPRMVMLILGSGTDNVHDYAPATVRAYLDALHVPLRVWSPDPDVARADSPWGPVRDVSPLRRLLDASRDVVAEVRRQFIAWIDGEHLPQSIGVVDPAGTFRIAR